MVNSTSRISRILMIILLLASFVIAKEAINKAVSPAIDTGVTSTNEIFGTAKDYADANKVDAPKWAQITSLGLAVWKLILFVVTATRYAMRPVLYLLNVLHHTMRPVTLLMQLIYHLVIGVPLSVLQSVTRTLYPAYLFLGSAAVIGLLVGLGLASVSKLIAFFLPSHYDEPKFSAMKSAATSPESKRTQSLRNTNLGSSKKSPPSTRTVMSSQPSLQTPTIMEESEFSSGDEIGFNTDSDEESRGKSHRGYMDYKKVSSGDEGIRRRN